MHAEARPCRRRALIASPPFEASPNALGDGYRVEVRIVIWEAADVVKVPTSALVRQGDRWAVFVVDGDRIRRVTVAVGQRNAEEAEIQSGLEAGAQVVVHPNDRVVDGALVEVRASRES